MKPCRASAPIAGDVPDVGGAPVRASAPTLFDVAPSLTQRPGQAYRPASGSIPDQPGVYRFSDADGRVIYVGKAKSLRSRLNSYFADPASMLSRTRSMVATAAKVDWTVVQTEVEALQLEYSWIKEFDPRFNIKYRDDKSYPWLAVTLSEEFPRVMVGRGPKRKGTRYFGPYSHAWAIRETVDLLLRVFPMRSCRPGVFKNHKQLGRPCLLGYIGKCSAPCIGRVDEAEHRAIVDDFCQFVGGQAAPMIKRLEREMRAASDAHGVRAGGPAARRHRRPAAGHGAERRGLPGRHRRGRDRPRRGPARGGGADLPRPGRAGPRPARLGGRTLRRLRHATC